MGTGKLINIKGQGDNVHRTVKLDVRFVSPPPSPTTVIKDFDLSSVCPGTALYRIYTYNVAILRDKTYYRK